jgi:hypothetical protein
MYAERVCPCCGEKLAEPPIELELMEGKPEWQLQFG